MYFHYLFVNDKIIYFFVLIFYILLVLFSNKFILLN